MVYCIASYELRHDGLERDQEIVDADLPPKFKREFFAQKLDHVRLARSGTPVQQIPKRFAPFFTIGGIAYNFFHDALCYWGQCRQLSWVR